MTSWLNRLFNPHPALTCVALPRRPSRTSREALEDLVEIQRRHIRQLNERIVTLERENAGLVSLVTGR